MVTIYEWKLARIKYLSGSCFSSDVAFWALDETGPLLPQSKCIVQVKSTSVQRLWYLPFQIGFSCSNMAFKARIFKFMGFFLLSTYWMHPILHEIFFVFSQSILLLLWRMSIEKNKRSGKRVPVYSVRFTVSPPWQSHHQISVIFWFYLVVFFDISYF